MLEMALSFMLRIPFFIRSIHVFGAFIILTLCVLAPVHAQTLEEKFDSSSKKKGSETFVNFTVENDLFGNGDDRNYTNGARLTWFNARTTPPLAARFVDRHLPLFTLNDSTSVYYSIGQNLYAPRDLSRAIPDPNDRPYGAFLYGSMGLTSLTDDRRDNVEVTVGVVGPAAFGEQTQKFVHRLTDSDTPAGWDAQLENEPGLIISWERIWPEVYSADIAGLHFRTAAYGGATLGNIYTYGNSGLIFQLVPQKYKWQGLPIRVRPAMPGSAYFDIPESKFSWSLFAGLEGRAVARNIFLDGNTWRDSASVDKRNLVGDANVGLAFTYGQTQLSYTLNWRSKEYHGQDQPDLFGAIGLSHRF